MKRRGILAISILCFLFTMAVPLFHPSGVSAVAPPTNQLPPGQNLFQDIYNDCQGVSSQGLTTSKCNIYQNALESALSCSPNMFVSYNLTVKDSAGNATNVTKWYINEAEFKSCWENAGSQLTTLNSSNCQTIDKSSTYWGFCTKAQDNLNAAIGNACTSQMYNSVKNSVNYTLRTTKLANCTTAYNAVGNLQIDTVDSSGNVTKDSNPISSSQVQDSNTGTDSTSGSSVPTCDTSGFSLSFIACPIVNAMANGADDIYNGLIHPLLVIQPIDLSNNCQSLSNDCKDPSSTYAVWSEFRIYGDIFLIIALLVIVFGESIGGGTLDAYSVKKVLPRLLIAAVLINLSIYIVALAIDITNILGAGIESLLEAPFKDAGAFTISISGVANGIGLGALLGSAGLIWKLGILSQVMPVIAFLFVIPAFLTLLAIMATVVIRRGLILFLIFVSPIAFVLYCLPNTEKYFRRWWDLFMRTLLVYPLIAIFFAMGNILSVTISQSSSGLSGDLADLLSEVALFLPLFLIPYSFRIAGGILGRVHEFSTTARNGVNKLFDGKRQQSGARLGRATVQGRQEWYNGLNAKASKNFDLGRPGGNRALKAYGRTRNFALARAARAVGGYNIEALASTARAEEEKEVNDQTTNGMDPEVRGLTVDKAWALNHGKEAKEGSDDGDWRVQDGKRQFKSAAGAWVDEADVDAGHKRWDGKSYAFQAALAYEMRKADKPEDVRRLTEVVGTAADGTEISRYQQIASANGLTEQQAGAAWIGAAFEQQDKHLEFKYTNWKTGKMDAKGRAGFASEVFEKRGSYAMSQMHASTINALTEAYDAAGKEDGDAGIDTQKKIASIAETFVSRYGGATGAGGETDEQQILAARQQAEQAQRAAEAQQPSGGEAQTRTPYVAPSVVQTNSSGSASNANAVRELARTTNVLRPLSEPTDIGPMDSGPDIPRQH